MSRLRLVLGLLAAGLVLLLLGPLRAFAQSRGWRLGRSAAPWFQRLVCAALGVEVRVHGRPAPGKRLIVANHVSWLDIPVLGSIEPMTFLAKKEVGAPALGGRLARLQGIIFVDRGRRRCIPSVNAEMARAMVEGEPVTLFAEATTGDGNRILRFRSSHFEAVKEAAAAAGAAVIQPVFLDYSRLVGLSVGRRDRPLFAWYGDMTFMPHFRRFVAVGPTRCDVHYGPPIAVSAEMGRKTLARRTEAEVRALAGAARAANCPILAGSGSS
jgi:1-acyl-sn-glycerol-3-phosphate acyltransferase